MASLPTGSDKLLQIRTAQVDIVIKSKGKQIPFAVSDSEKSSSLEVVAADIESISIPIQGMSEEYSNHEGTAVHEMAIDPMFFEQTDYIISAKARNGEQLEFKSNSSLIEAAVGRVIDDDATVLNGVINFGNNVGFFSFTIIANGNAVAAVRLEVYPSKISYREDYREMMEDINNLVSESILDFMRKTYMVFVPDHKRNEIPAVFFTILETVFDKYMQAANRIIAVPHHKLITEHDVVPFYKAKRTDGRSLKWLEKHPEYVIKDDGKVKAERVLTAKKQITYDTQENRLVKFMLQSTIRRTEDFKKRYIACTKNPDREIISGAEKMERELKRLIGNTFLAEVSDYNAAKSMSLVFGMAPGYRELYKYYLMLLNGISVGGDVFNMSVKETAQLYEYWCFIKLYAILKDRYELKSPDIIKVDRSGVTVDLAKGKSSTVKFYNPKNGESFSLTYNQSEMDTQTVNQKPDNVLELEKKGASNKYKYVFDAKYRIENNPDGAFYPDSKPGPKVDDINTMHRYRDSIVYENTESRFTFEKTMFGAYILFPYSNEEEYKNHRFFKSIETVNIGGLPFLPSATSLVTEMLDALISDSSESAFERATLPRGIEDRIRTVDWKRRDVLIGLVPDDAHMDWFRDEKMYFTRAFDEANLPIRYIALYEKGVGIRYYGEFINWSKQKRSRLPGKSEHMDAEYHVFNVLKWNELPALIEKEENGPNPIAYTNFFLLSHAKSYSELRLRSEAEYRLFIELKRRIAELNINLQTSDMAFETENAKVIIDEEKILVISPENDIVAEAKVSDFAKHPNKTFRQLQSAIE